MQHYDVIVIGAGPGGYVAALRAAQLGLTTACVESWRSVDGDPALGGTCLNVGCIPSKALLETSHLFAEIKDEAKQHGIHTSAASINVAEMMARKDRIVVRMTQGIRSLLKKNAVDLLAGHGAILAESGADHYRIAVSLETQDEPLVVAAKHVIIATGSKPAILPSATADNLKIVDSTGALSFSEAPRRLGIIGAGAIGLELGSVWKRLGTEVTLLEALPSFLAPVDEQISKQAYQIFTQRQGLEIKIGARVTGVGSNNQEVIVMYEDAEGKRQISVDKLIVAVGRVPHTEGLGAKDCGLQLDDRGFIKVDDACRTNLPNVYAIGDVIGGAMLAHKASEQGVAVAERIAGHATPINHALMPWIIYTWPEIAWVGMTEQTLKAQDVAYCVGTFPFSANSRANVMGRTEGMVKIIADRHTDSVLGVHILGPNASELIAEAVLAMAFDASSEDIARTIHSHPTLSEAVHEAALGVDGRTLHI